MTLKSKIMDSSAVLRALKRISFEITEKNHGTDNICLIGIKTRGIPLSRIISENLEAIENQKIPTGTLDITLYRDDLSKVNTDAQINSTNIPFDITGKTVILVDDVIYTGRTVRAAIDAIFTLGRPSSIQLAVLIDRGHRELPLRPDYVGKNIPTALSEIIKVSTNENDGVLQVDIYDKN